MGRTTDDLDGGIPNPFGAPGCVAWLVSTAVELPHRVEFEFANGRGVIVLYGSEPSACHHRTRERPYEAHATHGNDGRGPILCEQPVAHACPLDDRGVRALLAEIAALPADPACPHRRA